MRSVKEKIIVAAGIFIMIAALVVTSSWAQGYPPGFSVSLEWENYKEQSKVDRDIEVSDIGARVGYSFPQTVDLFIALSWQDVDVKLPNSHPDPNVRLSCLSYDLDPALAFKVGAKAYIFRDIPMGLPADFTLALSYNTAKHKEDSSGLKFTHRRIIGNGGLEWHYLQSTPYLNLGLLHSEIDTPNNDYDETSILFAGGVSFNIVDNINLKAEINWCQEIGYMVGIEYRF